MEDITRADRRIFRREFFRLDRVILGVGSLALAIWWLISFPWILPWSLLVPVVIAAIWVAVSHQAAQNRRFQNRHYEYLWRGCQERLAMLEDALKRMRRDQIADLQEMPRTIRAVGESLYVALRRADIISCEVLESERKFIDSAPVWQSNSRDPQTKELYQLADRNIAEYRQHFAGVMSGCQRAEAQAAVYMTTLDMLRMKIIGYRLVGRSPELASADFLASIAEAKLQLQAIDQALDELDLSHYPKMVATVPPPVPDEIRQRIEGSG